MFIPRVVIRFALPLVLLLPLYPAAAQDGAQADTAAAKSLPLKPERSFKLTTDEGSWISLDVSPDGATLVFDLLGDLYLLPISGGKATPLSTGMAFDSQPRFSPDGRQVLFVTDRDGSENVWTLDLATKEYRQITKDKSANYHSPEWMPDGKYVVASRGEGRFGTAKLWIGHVDGGSGASLVPEPKTLRMTGAAPTPDGRYIWYAQRQGTWQYNAMFPQYQLGLYDRETGRTYSRSARPASAFRPTLSPDGRWLVYGSRHEDQTGLVLRDLQSGDERWLAYPVQRDDQESVATRDVLPGMAFTPDSRALVASYGGKLWRIPVDGGAAQPIPMTVDVDLQVGPRLAFEYPVEDGATFKVSQIRDAVPSPDGRRLAFTALDRLYVMDFGGQPRRLTSENVTEAQPAWSPDGQSIAYVTWSDADGGHIQKVGVDGGEPRRLTTQPAIYQTPAFSPDGARIAAVRGPAQAYRDATGPFAAGATEDLVWVPAQGGDAVLIAAAEGRARPHFTLDAARIYLFHGENGLVSIRWDGSDERKHLKVAGNMRPGQEKPNPAGLILVSPGGGEALAQVNHDLYVVTVPPLGGEPQTISVADPASAAFPARKLTDIGGQFPAWSADGASVHWSIGPSHFRYTLAEAKAFEENLAKEQKAREEAGKAKKGKKPAKEEARKEEPKKYEPTETAVAIEIPRDVPQGVVLLTGARLVTMKGDEVIERGDLLVRNNRIEAVGPAGTLSAPDDARVIDVAGKTIVPGFVDTHAHMWPAWGVHKPQEWTYLANLAYGVTTTRDPQTGTTDVLTYGDAVEAGMMIGPRIYSTGPGVFGDYIDDTITDLDRARDVLKRYSQYYDTKTIKMYMAGNRQQRQWILMAAKEQKLLPTTEGGLDLKYNLSMIQDGYPGQEHSFPVYPLYDDVVKLTAETGMAYTPTLLVSYGGPFGENYYYTNENPHDDAKLRRFTPHSEVDEKTRRRGPGNGPGPGGWFRDEEYVFQEHAAVAKRIADLGGIVGVGSHGQLQGLGYHWELWSLQSGGMTPLHALRSATLHGAQAIGLALDLGSLEKGKLADLVILDENPLESIRHTNTIRYVMKNGRLYEGDTLDEIYPRQRKAPVAFTADPGPEVQAGIR